ncbi:MAG TPA: hypothetical protein VK985_03080 [Rariglobus sp.]|nr:hypothetical protein [Rariglobus sp.]
MPSFARISFYNKCKALFPRLAEFDENLKLLKQVRKWRRNGWQTPLPGLMKRVMIKAEARRIGATTLVETGTYMGDTIWFFRRDFIQLFSIEIHPELARLARERFASWPGVKIVEGDSATKLAEIIPEITGPCAFWLDGHYSAGITGRGSIDCPIWGEFDAIIGKMKHPFIILIDDARCFGTDADYPTLAEVDAFVKNRLPGYSSRVENDIIRITPAVTKE